MKSMELIAFSVLRSQNRVLQGLQSDWQLPAQPQLPKCSLLITYSQRSIKSLTKLQSSDTDQVAISSAASSQLDRHVVLLVMEHCTTANRQKLILHTHQVL
jgi:hypothetical protein